MSITEISIKRPALVIVVFTVLGILGVLSYQQLNYNLLPEFDAPRYDYHYHLSGSGCQRSRDFCYQRCGRCLVFAGRTG